MPRGRVAGGREGRGSTPRCYQGANRLIVTPSSVRPSQLVALRLQGPWSHLAADRVGTENYGLLGRATHGKFVPLYNIAVIAKGVEPGKDLPVPSGEGIGGVGLPDRPFRVRIPKVTPANYVLEFNYGVMQSTGRSKTYLLCSRLHARATGAGGS